MARKRCKASQKNSHKNAKSVKAVNDARLPEVKNAIFASPSETTNGYIIRKIKKQAISTKSLFSVPYLSEGITIFYSKNEDIPMLIHEAVPSFSIESVDRLWRTVLTFPSSDVHNREVQVLDETSQSNYALNSLCIFNSEAHRVSAVQAHPPTSKGTDHWIMFVAKDALEEPVATLSKYNQSKHILSFENGVLHWTKSSGNLDVIRTHIDGAESTSHIFDNLSDLDKQLVLLCAGNGTGKTTLINHLVNQAKTIQPDLVVLSIILGNHSQLLGSGMVSQPLNFIKEAAGIESLSQQLFESALDEERLSVLFDCSDLISPKELEQFCKLIQGLKKTYVKNVLVVGSLEQKRYLEDQLSTLAIDLCKFSNEDQKCALKNSWKDLLSNELEETRLDEIVQKILQAMSQGTSELEKEFVGMPLLTHMIAEVFRNLVCENADLCEIPGKLGFLEIFDQYFERKCSVAAIKDFENIALDIFLAKENGVDFLQNGNAKASQESIQCNRYNQKDSIINSHRDGKPHFTHTIFADYFAAKWFASSGSRIANALDLLLKPEYRKTLFFYNRILAKDFQLHTSVLNDDLECVKMLMGQCVDINARDLGGRTALHLAASQGVTNDQKVNATRNEILDLLILGQKEDNTLEMTPLQYAIATQSWSAIDKLIPHFPATADTPLPMHNQQMLDYIIDNDLGLLMDLCFERGFVLENTHDACKVLLPRACELGSIRVATVLIKNGANLWITYAEGDSPLHISARFGHLEIVRLLINTVKSVSESIRKTVAGKVPYSGKLPSVSNYINLTTKCNETALDLTISFAQVDVAKYLLQENAVMRNPMYRLQCAVGNSKCDAHIVKTVLDAIKVNDRAQSINRIMFRLDGNSIHSAVMTGNVDMVRHILDAGGSATMEKLNGRTPLMIAAWWGQLEVVKFLLERVPQYKRMKYINKLSEDGMTALRCATFYGQAKVVAYLLEQNANKGPLCELINFAAGNLKADARVVELILSVIPAKDRARYINTGADVGGNGLTAVFVATREGNLKGLEMLIRAGGKVTNPDGNPHTALMEAALGGNLGIVRLLVESTVKQGLSKYGYINATNAGVNALHTAIIWGHLDIINYLIREKAEIISYVLALMIAAVNFKGDVKVVDTILGLMSASEKIYCVLERDEEGNTVMHLAARSGNLDMIIRFKENGGKFTALNFLKETPLMILASKGHTRAVKYLLDNFDEEKEGMTKLKYINLRNKNGLSAVSAANKNGHGAVMAYITQSLRKLLQDVLGE